MELLVKKRGPIRGNFTKTYNNLVVKLNTDDPGEKDIRIMLTNLERIHYSLSELDNEIGGLLLDNPDAGTYEAEYAAVEDYNSKMVDAKVSTEMYLNKLLESNKGTVDNFLPQEKRQLKLPKIELLKFNGEIKNWLAFWSQFKRIHEDERIENEDKFQYLIQSISEGTRAREIIDSYPPTNENYSKAIESLKSRFGKDELLIEFYVRELLKLVIINATEARRKLSTSQIYDKLETYLRALESIGLTSDRYSAMLFPLVESCIPEDIFRVWLRNPIVTANDDSSNNVYTEKLKNLLLFLKTEIEGEERIQLAKSGFSPKVYNIRRERVSEPTPHATATDLFSGGVEKGKKINNCIFCEKLHESKECYYARKLNFEKKQEALRNKKCCFTCFKPGHQSKVCKSRVQCLLCNKRHWALMCPELPQNKTEVKTPGLEEKPNISLSNHCVSEEVLLQTLQVYVEAEGKSRKVRALIDSGSQRSYLLKKTVQEMNLKPSEYKSVIHSVFGGSTLQKQDHRLYEITLQNLNTRYRYNIQVLDQQIICGNIPRIKKGIWEKELKEKNITISDLGKGCPDIELLIGADFCGQLFTGNLYTLKCGLVTYETKLGWIIMGKVSRGKQEEALAHVVTSLLIKNSTIADLWNIETLGIRDPVETKSKAEIERNSMVHFLETVERDDNGRYIVKLPWLENKEILPNNKSIAEQRCNRTSQKLKDEGRYIDYEAVFKEWLGEGIIEKVPEEELENSSYYLPHRGIFKKNSTTKVRPVFDASCRVAKRPSLNECLEKGPNLIEQIPPILMKFRQNDIGVISDIKKAFLQISIAREDQDVLRFLWWKDCEKRKFEIFRHQRLVFGLTCSPFLLAAVINYHLETTREHFPETSKRLQNSFYVDNCITSVSNTEDLSRFIREARQLLAMACFDLRGWECNVEFEKNDITEPSSVLGLLWNKKKDVLFCDLQNTEFGFDVCTKRNILSATQKIFDPLGFVCPVTICLKLMVQESWKLKIGWDEILPDETQRKFKALTSELKLLSSVKIPRCVKINDCTDGLSLHTFCDASKVAYSAVVFLRNSRGGDIQLYFIQAKSRVAPLKTITIPRLELLACCIGARLASTIRKAMNLEDIQSLFWTDSSAAVYWIQREDYWGTFVNNRVEEIRNLSSKEEWRHIPGTCNPADLPSRGCSVQGFLKSGWWEGPQWLKLPEEEWPATDSQYNPDEVFKEKRKGIVSLVNLEDLDKGWYLRKFSKYTKIVHLIAWMFRFAKNCRHPENKIKGHLTVSELDAAENELVKIVQQETFNKENVESKLKTLCVFTDAQGLIRLKTKIIRRDDTENFRCPLILPSDHRLVERLIFERHLSFSHAGAQVVLADIRKKFWLLRGKKTVQRVLSKCIRCKRYTTKKIEAIPAPLPEDRVREALVFEVTGVDLAGRLLLRDGKKAWILLFTCAVYRAIHLELIQSLSTDAFLLGFRRFIARRGRPKTIFSDNGTNFVGANNLIGLLDWDKIEKVASVSRIQWKCNPPTAAWWGGFWERIIQMVKKLLRRVLGKASLHYEEMFTILCDVEATINSRPLNYLSEDPNDLTSLTPSMFIQETQTVGVPDIDTLDKVSITKRYRYQQKLREDVRKRFREEYLGMLIQRPQKSDARQIKVGDVVIVGSDGKKRLDWPLGKIMAMYPGKDGHTRVVKLKTAGGELIRPVQRLYPLELDKDDYVIAKNSLPVSSGADGKTMNSKNDDSKKTRCGRRVIKPSRYN